MSACHKTSGMKARNRCGARATAFQIRDTAESASPDNAAIARPVHRVASRRNLCVCSPNARPPAWSTGARPGGRVVSQSAPSTVVSGPGPSERSSHAKQTLGAGRGQRRCPRGALDRHRSAEQRFPCAWRRSAHAAGQGKPDWNSSVSATPSAPNRYEKAHAAFTKRDPKCRGWERPHPRRIASPARKRRRQTLPPPLANPRAPCYP